MKYLYIALFVLGALCSAEAYSTDHDNFNIEEVVADDNKLKAFVGCFIDKAECSEVLTALKNDMLDAVQTSCSKCNDRQKEMFKIFLNGLKKLPVEYEEYQKKYDPDNKYFEGFLASVNKV